MFSVFHKLNSLFIRPKDTMKLLFAITSAKLWIFNFKFASRPCLRKHIKTERAITKTCQSISTHAQSHVRSHIPTNKRNQNSYLHQAQLQFATFKLHPEQWLANPVKFSAHALQHPEAFRDRVRQSKRVHVRCFKSNARNLFVFACACVTIVPMLYMCDAFIIAETKGLNAGRRM